MKYRDVVKLLEADGWYYLRQQGSHMQFAHPSKPHVVSVPGGGKMGRDIPVGIANAILKQAGIRK